MSKGLIRKYFVLKPKGSGRYATASRTAMRAYAASIETADPELAIALWDWADRELKETKRKQDKLDPAIPS